MNTFVTVNLDRPRRIAFTNLALYRMSTLQRPFELSEITAPGRSFGALVAWAWAMLVPEDASDFPSPENIAAHLPMRGDARNALLESVVAAINAALPDEKNADGSTRKPSPSSSSGSKPKRSGA